MKNVNVVILLLLSSVAFAKAKEPVAAAKPEFKKVVDVNKIAEMKKTSRALATKSEKMLKCMIFENVSGEKKKKLKSKCELPFSMLKYDQKGKSFYHMNSCTLNFIPSKDKGGINGLVQAMVTLDSTDPNRARLTYKFMDGPQDLKSQSFEYFSKDGGVFKATDEQLLVISREEADAEKKTKGRSIAMTCATK